MEILQGTNKDYIKLNFMDNGLKSKVYQYREVLEKLEMGNVDSNEFSSFSDKDIEDAIKAYEHAYGISDKSIVLVKNLCKEVFQISNVYSEQANNIYYGMEPLIAKRLVKSYDINLPTSFTVLDKVSESVYIDDFPELHRQIGKTFEIRKSVINQVKNNKKVLFIGRDMRNVKNFLESLPSDCVMGISSCDNVMGISPIRIATHGIPLDFEGMEDFAIALDDIPFKQYSSIRQKIGINHKYIGYVY